MGSDDGDVVSTMYSCMDTDSLSLNTDVVSINIPLCNFCLEIIICLY
jgi:hypothetical protein